MMLYMAEERDTRASQAVYAARLFERALHDAGPWSITWGPHEVDASRLDTDTSVVFEAVFPEACYLERPAPHAVLRCRGEVMAVRAIDFPGDSRFVVTWALAAKHLAHDRD